ncbi:MAG TPA: muramoyltetrapeptide carboxypeptidase [Burkholderiaceae bacterium]|jgi:muramoyltetrapeptide carboxypeptidase|nr:muramoyltetrapeptide carboxypeptidase [Burkholderiaceae bacterium]
MSEISLKNVGVAIVAPGSYAPDEAAFLRGLEHLRSLGCIVHNYYEPKDKFQRFGGTDEARLQQIQAAVANPDVQIVLWLRGSYGLSRLLPQIDFEKMAASGKLFVGHSDFTPFHMGLLNAGGAVSFAGPMLCDDFSRTDISEFTMQHFWQCIKNPTHTITVQSANNPALDITGPLWGGNLAMMTHLVGTPYLAKVEGGILFLEDIAEHPYRIERMVLQLLYSGVLARQKALILGDFSNYRLAEIDNGYDFEAMLAYLRAHLPIPVLTGLQFGHIRDKVTLAVGSKAHLVSDGKLWELTMSDYPHL